MNFVYQFGASTATSGPMSTCEEKTMSEIDRLKILERVAAGEISNVPGIDEPYEPPAHPAVTIDTEQQSVADGAAAVLAYLDHM